MKRACSAALVLAAASLVLPNAARAKTTYLTCHYVERLGGAETLEITADDTAGSVAYLVPRTGFSQTVRAAFTRDQVTFSDNFIMTWTINRTDLSFIADRANVGATRGACKLVAPPPKRAF